MEEPRAFAGLGIDAREVRAFVVVVCQTSQRQVRRRGFAAVLSGNNPDPPDPFVRRYCRAGSQAASAVASAGLLKRSWYAALSQVLAVPPFFWKDSDEAKMSASTSS